MARSEYGAWRWQGGELVESAHKTAYYWQGDRVRLRSLRPADVEAKWQEYQDSHARQMLEYCTELPVMSREAYTELFAAPDDDPRRISLYVENLEGVSVGWLNLFDLDQRHGTFGVGISIFCEHRGNGYALDALRLALGYAFEEMRMQKCNSACLAINEASIALHERLGFWREGVRRRVAYMGGAYHDEVLYGLTQEEYADRWRTAPESK
jgi:RimJ/RimL family protein N-acetyltransferase